MMEAPRSHSTLDCRLCIDVLEAISCSQADSVEIVKIMAARAIYGSVSSLDGCYERLNEFVMTSKVAKGSAENARRLIDANQKVGLPDIFPTGNRNEVTLVWESFDSKRHTQLILSVDNQSFEMITTSAGKLSTYCQRITYSGGEIASVFGKT